MTDSPGNLASMKVYISADIEGVSGLVAWSQCGGPNAQTYDWAFARERMTADVNAAIRGARASGAKEIFVKDSHGGSKNLLASDLEAGATLISGCGSHPDGMMAGIDKSYDAAMLIGYHSMAGTLHGIMEHTISGNVHRMWINGVLHGEQGLSAMVAGAYGVPIVAVSSDKAGCDEASSFLKGVRTAVVKRGYGRYMGECLHPSEALNLIETAAKKGLASAKQIKPWKPGAPTTIRIEFNRSEEADSAARMVGMDRIDAYTLEYKAKDAIEAHQAARAMISAAMQGASANT